MQTGLRRADTTKGPPLRILSLDGGGVRGYSMLILLQELMYRTYVECEGKAPRRDEIPKPCEYFDLIAGTGTGGLIAIMLGRLRLDLETCKEVYVRMTRRVFETDKTIAGIPFRSTLFKASKLEEAIRDCVREHSIDEDEGNDGAPISGRERPVSSPIFSSSSRVDRTLSTASSSTHGSTRGSFSQRDTYSSPLSIRSPLAAFRWGNPNALLEDRRENRTKTAVTAVYKGTRRGMPPALLRSYDSRKEAAPEENITIWQAGRATCATALAFKPIQIGQSVFIDEGSGTYNPAPLVLEEAAVNEWPSRDIGVFVSVGTGKRPPGTSNIQQEWWEGFIGGSIGDFAEARRKLIAKIEACEDTHRAMMKDHLSEHGVNRDNYYRLNVEVGVGEFGMNEWNRLADISTSTRRYLAKGDVQEMVLDASTKLARIERSIRRHRQTIRRNSPPEQAESFSVPPPWNPMAVELPGDIPLAKSTSQLRQPITFKYNQPLAEEDKFVVLPPDQDGSVEEEYGVDGRLSESSIQHSPRLSEEDYERVPPPPPPKTPLPYPDNSPNHRRRESRTRHKVTGSLPPYPESSLGPPPPINMARKPELTRR